jgi:hypothetical protein
VSASKAARCRTARSEAQLTLSACSSMSMYQFLIAVRQQDGQQLMNEQGETTSHLMGETRRASVIEGGLTRLPTCRLLLPYSAHD